jgi:hypothetical protein
MARIMTISLSFFLGSLWKRLLSPIYSLGDDVWVGFEGGFGKLEAFIIEKGEGSECFRYFDYANFS